MLYYAVILKMSKKNNLFSVECGNILSNILYRGWLTLKMCLPLTIIKYDTFVFMVKRKRMLKIHPFHLNGNDLIIDKDICWMHYSVDQKTSLGEVLKNAPSWLTDIQIHTSFWYRGEKKIYIGTDDIWPPRECIGRKSKFTLPIKICTINIPR